jgi:hypothetical protein
MAVRWAIASGNFSSTATWNDGGVLGIPTTGDDVYTNSFTVAMDTNATVNSLNNSARARDIATPAMTANNAPSPYVAAASSGAAPWNAFNRNIASSNFWEGGPNTGWLSMDFGSTIIINGYTIYGADIAGTNVRSWEFQGSNNNSTWITLDTVSLGAAIPVGGTYSVASIGNTTAYRYYRLNILSTGGDGTRTRVAELELYQQYTAALASGGSFNFNTAGVTVSATSVSQAATNLFTVTHTTGTATLSVANNIAATASQTTLIHSGAGNFTFTCPNFVVNNSASTSRIVSKSSAGLITMNGNLVMGTGTNSGAVNVVLDSTNGNTIINGNVTGFPSSVSGGASTLNFCISDCWIFLY